MISIKCSAADLEAAQLIIIKSAQYKFFGEDLLKLSMGNSVTEASKLLNLNPILVNRVIRVGSRLETSSSLSYEKKHSIILLCAKVCETSKLLIEHFHNVCKHQGRMNE